MKKIGQSDFKPGYKINKLSSNPQTKKKVKSSKNEDHSFAYPNGIIPLIAINVLFVIGLSVVFGVGFGIYKDVFKFQWPNSLIAVAACHVLLNLLWVVARLDQVALVGFGTHKMKQKLKLNRIRDKMKIYIHDQAIDEVETHAEFVEFCSERKKYTKKSFYISLVVSGSVFAICLTIALIFQLVVIPTL
ncbi:MAG: hypothetical protein ACRC4M_00540 [Mycoplasma sp.]